MALDGRGGVAGVRGVVAAALCLLAIGGGWAVWPKASADRSGPTLAAADADTAARRTEAAARDAQAVWTRRFRAELGRAYAAADVRSFVRETASACAGAAPAEGPFYCDAAAEVGLDLAFFDGLGRRFQRESDSVSAVFVARMVAGHAQAGLGWTGAEAGDCLAGVWAADAVGRIGEVEPDLYGRLLVSAREIVAEAGVARPDAALFASGARAGRQDAYRRGLLAGRIAACAPRR